MFRRGETGQRGLLLQEIRQRKLAPEHAVQEVLVGLDRPALADRGPVPQRLAGVGLAHPVRGALARRGVAVDVVGAGVDGVRRIAGPAVLEGHFRPVGGLGGGLRRLGRIRAVGIVVVTRQQRIALQLGFDEGLKLQVRQLEQLDRLLELGRDDEPLPLPDLQPLTEPGHVASA